MFSRSMQIPGSKGGFQGIGAVLASLIDRIAGRAEATALGFDSALICADSSLPMEF
jgi:hypothetical protein